MHLALWPERPSAATGGEEWSFLLGVRDAVNAAIEPLRAAKELVAHHAEAEVTLSAPRAIAERLAPYRDEPRRVPDRRSRHGRGRPPAPSSRSR